MRGIRLSFFIFVRFGNSLKVEILVRKEKGNHSWVVPIQETAVALFLF